MSLFFRSLQGKNAAPKGRRKPDASKKSSDSKGGSDSASASDSDSDLPEEGVPQRTTYVFADVAIPPDFLHPTRPAPDARGPLTYRVLDWAASALPENGGRYAAVLDNVLSPSECGALLALAEASVPACKRGRAGTRTWSPALVNFGGGFEVLDSGYRNSDRIIWDRREVVDRLWARMAAAVPELRDRLAAHEEEHVVLGGKGGGRGARQSAVRTQRWEFLRVNDRMRFLRYGPGQFFHPHCDAPYRPDGPEPVKTVYTVHLYLNDSVAEAGGSGDDDDDDDDDDDAATLVGGATSFLSRDESRKMDVDPRAGRILIFQHSGLYHSGDEVRAGTKFTMRTDILYKMVPQE